ncbi:cytidine deaminase [Candidatus Dojkabacteria bacterium]|nr:cytidine deaminase [Candidatus Dojkabacteria bacterium]
MGKRPSWDEYFFNIVEVVSSRSHDENTHYGCVVVDQNNRIVATGYNGFPSGIDDSSLPSNREDKIDIDIEGFKEVVTKYDVMIHAEINAISTAARSLAGCKLYITAFPCLNCSKTIIASGIKTVVYKTLNRGAQYQIGASMFLFEKAGVECKQFIE